MVTAKAFGSTHGRTLVCVQVPSELQNVPLRSYRAGGVYELRHPLDGDIAPETQWLLFATCSVTCSVLKPPEVGISPVQMALASTALL